MNSTNRAAPQCLWVQARHETIEIGLRSGITVVAIDPQ
jgi:hypothetical protein